MIPLCEQQLLSCGPFHRSLTHTFDRQTFGKASIVQCSCWPTGHHKMQNRIAAIAKKRQGHFSTLRSSFWWPAHRKGGFSGCTAEPKNILNRLRRPRKMRRGPGLQKVLVFFGVRNQDCESHNSAYILLLMPLWHKTKCRHLVNSRLDGCKHLILSTLFARAFSYAHRAYFHILWNGTRSLSAVHCSRRVAWNAHIRRTSMQLGHLEIDEASQARQKAGRCKTPKFHIAGFFFDSLHVSTRTYQ